MKWTPKKTWIVIVTLALVVDIALGAAVNTGVFPVGTETARILEKVFIAIGVVLLLSYVRAIDAKEPEATDMNETHVYRVGYHCPICPNDHLTDQLIRSPNAYLDGRPFTDAYGMAENAPEVQQFLGTKRRCPNKTNIDVVLKPEDCYLETALPAQF
jgi:hypothetical protein